MEDEARQEAMEDPCFYEHCVPDTLGYLNQTLNKFLNLVNAMSFIYHSVAMRDEELQADLEERLQQAQPGDVIDLPEPPALVFIRIEASDFSAEKKKFLSDNFEQWEDPNEVEDNDNEDGTGAFPSTDGGEETNNNKEKKKEWYIIPIRESRKGDFQQVPVRAGQHHTFWPSRVQVRNIFPLDTAFAITINKAQGQTLKKVILAISNHPVCRMSYAHLYVALSRIRDRSDLRLLLLGDNDEARWDSVSYVDGLKPDPFVRAFLHAYKGGTPDKDGKRTWDSKLAVESFVSNA